MPILQALDVAELTDVGKKRQRNEDASRMVVPLGNVPDNALGGVFIVADGMGGLGGGDVASRIAVDEMVRRYFAPDNKDTDVKRRFYDALEGANVAVREQAPKLGLQRIGSTCAGMVVREDGEALIFNVGDCRVYRARNGVFERISYDQSIMERQREAGMSEEAIKAARSSVVTAFLGQPIPIQPIMKREKVQNGDVYVICSDGLWSLAEAPEIERIVLRHTAADAARRLVNLALRRGGTDNITVIVLRIGAPPPRGVLLPLAFLAAAGLLALGALYIDGASFTPNPSIATPGALILTEEATQPATVEAAATQEAIAPTADPTAESTVESTLEPTLESTIEPTAEIPVEVTVEATAESTPPPSESF
jgi:PPM family protein phosphatase